MTISSNFNSINNSMFNMLAQGKTMQYANKLSNSKFLFPENTAPGKGTSTDTVSYISDIKEASGDLSGALKALSGSAFNQKGVVSSNTDAMTVSYNGSSASLNSMKDMKVKIDQVAAGQKNEGEALKTANTYSGDKGTNKFTVETGGKTTELSVNISATDTNKAVQDKMAKAINEAGLGLKATVETDSKTGTSVLKVESTKTGADEKNSFEIKDVSGNAVATTGAGTMTSAAQDAIYSVNGGAQQTSKTNTVSLGNGVSATLKAASDEEVTVTRGKDTSAAISAVEDMVSSYNKLFTAAADRTGDTKAQGLASRMVNVSSVYSKQLSDVGIGFDNSGKMTIDSDKLNKAAEDGSLEKLFTQDRGKNYGFTNQLERLASNVSNNTSAFVGNSVFGSANDIFGSTNDIISYSGSGSASQMAASRAGSIFDYSF